MARRSDHSREEIRALALAAAARIVTDEGVAALTARRVASAIGYTVGTLYLVFDNLDDLLVHLNAATLGELESDMRGAAGRCRSAETCVRALARAYVSFAIANLNRWSLVFEHRLPEGMALPVIYQERIEALFGLVEITMAEMAGAPRGRALSRAARALWAGVHGVCILGLTGKLNVTGEMGVEGLADSLVDTYLRGLVRV